MKDDSTINHIRNIKLIQALYSGKKFYVECSENEEGALYFQDNMIKEIELPDFELYEEKLGYKWTKIDETESQSSALQVGFLPTLEENYQAQIAGFYNDDKTDEERKIRNAVIQEYEDLIAIYKSRKPSALQNQDVEVEAEKYVSQFDNSPSEKESFKRHFKEGFLKANNPLPNQKGDVEEYRDLLIEIDKALYVGEDLKDTEILDWYMRVIGTIKNSIRETLALKANDVKE